MIYKKVPQNVRQNDAHVGLGIIRDSIMLKLINNTLLSGHIEYISKTDSASNQQWPPYNIKLVVCIGLTFAGDHSSCPLIRRNTTGFSRRDENTLKCRYIYMYHAKHQKKSHTWAWKSVQDVLSGLASTFSSAKAAQKLISSVRRLGVKGACVES